MRCFVALWPSGELRDALARAVGPRIPAGCRAVPPQNYHLTLCFLGQVPETRVAALAALVEAMTVAPFTFDVDAVGHFERAAVAWVGPAADAPALARLRRDVVDRLSGAGFQFDAREFKPHVTVARHCRAPALAWHGPPIPWAVDGVALCRSDGTDTGVRYTVVARTAPASVR